MQQAGHVLVRPGLLPGLRRRPASESAYVIGEDIGIFPSRRIDAEHGTRRSGAGDGLMVIADRPEVRALAQFLATPEGIEGWVKRGKAIARQLRRTPAEWYEGNYKSEVAAGMLASATAFGFDASDLMPAAVGAGSFWTGMVDWISCRR